MADFIIKLDKQSKMHILKTRLQKGFRGPHEYEIICRDCDQKNDFYNNGFVVYPNLSSFIKIEAFKIDQKIIINDSDNYSDKRTSFELCEPDNEYNTSRLDDSLEVWNAEERRAQNKNTGINYGSSLLIKGVAGSLKTVLAMQFLYNGFLETQDSCLFISFRMHEDALKKVEIFNDETKKDFFDNYFRFYDGRDPFKSASQLMSEIKNEIESCDNIRRVVVFGIGMLNTYCGLRGEVLEFLQVLIQYFKGRNISSIFIDWFKSKDIQETLPTEYAQEFIGNQIDIRIKIDKEGNTIKYDKENPLREVFLERKEHRFSSHELIGNLILKKNKLALMSPNPKKQYKGKNPTI